MGGGRDQPHSQPATDHQMLTNLEGLEAEVKENSMEHTCMHTHTHTHTHTRTHMKIVLHVKFVYK